MMAPAAINLGIKLHVLAEAADVSATTAATYIVGDYRDYDTLASFARDVDVLTFDHEHVPTQHLAQLQQSGVPLAPGPDALVYAQDKLAMRAKMAELNLPQPDWRAVSSVEELLAAGQEIGFPVVLKTPRGGYDGKGVWVLESQQQAQDTQAWFNGDHEALLVEAKVDFQTELSAQIARSTTGETITYPIVETIQTNGVADIVKAPAPRLDASTAEAARHAAETIANGVDVTGMLAVELFHAPDSAAGFMINELAMRPHNTGHWTQDGAITSQFEQHLRAVLGLPLGATDPIAPYTVMKNYLGAGNHDLYGAFPLAMQKYPAAKIHAYGKSVRPGRKIGHVNVLATDGDLDEALTTAIDAAEIIRHGTTDY